MLISKQEFLKYADDILIFKGKEYLNFGPIGDEYPIIKESIVKKYNKYRVERIDELKKIPNYKNLNSYKNYIKSNVIITLNLYTDTCANICLRTFSLLFNKNPLVIESVKNLIIQLILTPWLMEPSLETLTKIKREQEKNISKIIELVSIYCELCIRHKWGLKSKLTIYDSNSIYLSEDKPALTRPEFADTSHFHETIIYDIFDSNLNPTNEIVIQTIIHESLHRVTGYFSKSDSPYLDDIGYSNSELERMSFEQHLINAHTFTLLIYKICKLQQVEVMKKAAFFEIQLVEQDNLWNLAETYLGHGTFWKFLWEINKGKMKSRNPNLVYPGEIIRIPL